MCIRDSCGAGMMPVAGHPPPAHEAKAKAARQKEISVIFFIRSLGRVQQQIGMNRQSRRRAERAVAAAGRAPPENSQPKANRSRKPSGNGDSRKPEQPASGNRRGTGTAGNRNRRQTADRPRRAAIRGGFAARSRGSPKQEYEKRAVQPGLCRGRTAPVGL